MARIVFFLVIALTFTALSTGCERSLVLNPQKCPVCPKSGTVTKVGYKTSSPSLTRIEYFRAAFNAYGIAYGNNCPKKYADVDPGEDTCIAEIVFQRKWLTLNSDNEMRPSGNVTWGHLFKIVNNMFQLNQRRVQRVTPQLEAKDPQNHWSWPQAEIFWSSGIEGRAFLANPNKAVPKDHGLRIIKAAGTVSQKDLAYYIIHHHKQCFGWIGCVNHLPQFGALQGGAANWHAPLTYKVVSWFWKTAFQKDYDLQGKTPNTRPSFQEFLDIVKKGKAENFNPKTP